MFGFYLWTVIAKELGTGDRLGVGETLRCITRVAIGGRTGRTVLDLIPRRAATRRLSRMPTIIRLITAARCNHSVINELVTVDHNPIGFAPGSAARQRLARETRVKVVEEIGAPLEGAARLAGGREPTALALLLNDLHVAQRTVADARAPRAHGHAQPLQLLGLLRVVGQLRLLIHTLLLNLFDY